MDLRNFFANLLLPLWFRLTAWFPEYRLSAVASGKGTKVVVSLTSMPSRIHKTWLVIESVLRQTVKPDLVVLSLSLPEFPDKQIPESLLRLKKRGLQIVFTGENLKPHNKYMYALENYPDANIITIDDDKIYPSNLIENLVNHHQLYPQAICAAMVRKIGFENGKARNYTDWSLHAVTTSPTHSLLSLGVSGALFPPNAFHKEIFDKNTLKQIALTADDLWLKVMAMKKGTPVASVAGSFKKPFLTINGIHQDQLRHHNVGQGANDVIFHKLCENYNITHEDFYPANKSTADTII